MAWSKSTTTKHTCGGPVFGKKTAGCPRCDELIAGATPVQWASTANKCGVLDEALFFENISSDQAERISALGDVTTYGETFDRVIVERLADACRSFRNGDGDSGERWLHLAEKRRELLRQPRQPQPLNIGYRLIGGGV